MDGRWRIELFGQLRLGRGEALPVSLQRQKATALLAYLAYHTRHPQPRDLLTELLWPEEDPEEGHRKLRFLTRGRTVCPTLPESPSPAVGGPPRAPTGGQTSRPLARGTPSAVGRCWSTWNSCGSAR